MERFYREVMEQSSYSVKPYEIDRMTLRQVMLYVKADDKKSRSPAALEKHIAKIRAKAKKKPKPI